MLCPNCKREIMNDSDFCQYCGTTIPAEERIFRCPNCQHILPEDSEFCNYCGTAVKANGHSLQPSIVQTGFNSEREDSVPKIGKQEKTKKPKLLITFLIIAAVLAVVFAGLNVFQYLSNEKNNQLLSSYAKQIKEKDNQINSINDQLKQANDKANQANDKADDYDRLVSALKNQNYGYASNAFNVDQGVVVLGTGKSKVLSLTTAFGGDVMISTSSDNTLVANVEFNEDNWEGDYTTITVKSSGFKGIARITFTNSIDSSSFQVLAIVV